MAERPAGPGGTVQHAVVVLEMRLVAEAEDTQGSGDGARTRGQDRADEQDFGVFPGRFAEEAAERVQDLYNGAWQVQHLLILAW